MLAIPWAAPFTDDGWVFELKWDGVRCLLSASGGEISLHSRAGNDMTRRYPELASGFIPGDRVLDGEIVALGQQGRPSFELLQGRMNLARIRHDSSPTPITYVVFDLLHDGEPLLDRPLEERYERLGELELPEPMVVADRYRGDAAPVWDFVVANDLEGIVAKRLGSAYQPGVRSPDWRKIGNFKQVRAIVGGFTEGTGGRSSTFGALLLGLWQGSTLRWIGSVGSGFNEASLRAIRSALDELGVSQSPFSPDGDMPAAAGWVEPRLVAVVRYKEWTTAGRLRAPSFKGFTDEPSESVTWEAEGPPG